MDTRNREYRPISLISKKYTFLPILMEQPVVLIMYLATEKILMKYPK